MEHTSISFSIPAKFTIVLVAPLSDFAVNIISQILVFLLALAFDQFIVRFYSALRR